MNNQSEQNQGFFLQHISEREQAHNSYMFWRITSRINSSNLLYFLSFVLQVVFGLASVILSISGVIQPKIISVGISILGSIGSMVGIYCLYHVINSSDAKNDLIKQAIHRVVAFKN